MPRPFADVFFQGSRKHDQPMPQHVLVRQREDSHDVARVTFDFEPALRDRYVHGRPVIIRWGWMPGRSEYFHGYVHHTEVHEDKNKHRTLDVYLVGASYRMKQVTARSFSRSKAHQVVMTIAREHNLSVTVERDEFIHEHLSTRGRSDWEFLVWLAHRCGYHLSCNKTDIRFVKRVIDTSPSHLRPTFVHQPGRARQRFGIYTFHHISGESVMTDGQRKQHVTMGVSDTGKVVRSSTAPASCKTGGAKASTPASFHKIHSHRPVHSTAEAQHLVNAEAERNRFHIRAEVETSGEVAATQGSTVRLRGLDTDNDGYWYVLSVDHVISRTDYRCDFMLGRDAMGDTTATGVLPTPLSTTGKPVLIEDCSIGLEDIVAPPPASVYDPGSDCPPIEELDGDPAPIPGAGGPVAAGAPQRAKPKVHKPTCHCCKGKKRAPKLSHIGAWRAERSRARYVSTAKSRLR